MLALWFRQSQNRVLTFLTGETLKSKHILNTAYFASFCPFKVSTLILRCKTLLIKTFMCNMHKSAELARTLWATYQKLGEHRSQWPHLSPSLWGSAEGLLVEAAITLYHGVGGFNSKHWPLPVWDREQFKMLSESGMELPPSLQRAALSPWANYLSQKVSMTMS